MGGKDPRRPRQLLQPLQGTELVAGQLLRSPAAQQVGTPRAADHQAAAGDDSRRLFLPVGPDKVGQVLGGVARGLHRDQPDRPDPDLVALAQSNVRELEAASRRNGDAGSGRRTDLEGAGDVVVVDVGLQHVEDADPEALRDREHPAHVSLGIDQRSLTIGGDEVAVVAEPRSDELLELHAGPLPREV